jgi:hypothetical protein
MPHSASRYAALTSLLLLLGSARPAAHAQAPDGPLQRSHVRDYIRLRTDIHQMQEKMKANADQYDDVIHAFFQRQAQFLQSEGWTQDGFDAVEQRILAAKGAMDWAADSTQRRKELEGISQMTGLDAETRQELRRATIREDSLHRARHIAPSRRDWPAVRPYLEGLQHLNDYVAKNRPDPPRLEDLPPASP